MNAELISNAWRDYFAQVPHEKNAREELSHINPSGMRQAVSRESKSQKQVGISK